MKARLENFLNQLNAPADTASLVLVRVVFGLLMFWSTISDFYFGWVTELYAKPQFHFQYEWFQWVKPRWVKERELKLRHAEDEVALSGLT